MSDGRRGLVSPAAAEHYEQHFVPALFAQWAPRLATAANARPGDHALDVACGTGVLARHLAERVGASGAVGGLDASEGMLAVAARHAPRITWREGRAEQLPFEEASFDVVVCQFGLMFFEDPVGALREMQRVLRPGRRMAVAVWDRLENSPGYAAVAALLEKLFGATAAEAIRAPFSLGERATIEELVSGVSLRGSEIRTVPGEARFSSIRSWMDTEICGWTLRDLLDEDDRRRLADEAEMALARFAGPGGAVAFSVPAHIVSGVKP